MNCTFSKDAQIAAIICVSVLLLFYMAMTMDKSVAIEKEITNRMAITNGASLNRKE